MRARPRHASWLACLASLIAWSAAPANASAGWSAPVRLSPAGAAVQVAEDVRGDLFAIWLEWPVGSGHASVVSDYRPAGSLAWQPPQRIADDAARPDTAVATDGPGDATALWSSEASLESSLRASSQGTWHQPTSVAPSFADVVAGPSLAVDEAGDAVAVWQTNSSAIDAAYRRAGATAWDAPVAISAPGEHSSNPSIAIRRGGEVAVAWLVYEPETAPCAGLHAVPCVLILKNRDSLKAATRSAGGAWQPPTAVTSAEAVFDARVALDEIGDITVIWKSSNVIVLSSFRTAGGAWSAPVTLASSDEYTRDVFDDLQLAVDGKGEATAAWVHSLPPPDGVMSTNAIEVATRPQGQWQTPTVIAGGDGSDGPLRLVVNESGAAAAVWTCEAIPTRYPTFVRAATRASASGDWSSPDYISGSDGWNPSIAIGQDGSVAAFWTEQSGFAPTDPAAGVYFAAYEPGGASVGVAQTNGCAAPVSPAITGLHMSHVRFKVSHSPTAITASTPKGSAFLFTLSAPSSVTVNIGRVTTGVARGHTCVARTRRTRHLRRCRRLVAVGRLARSSEPSGRDRLAFTGEIGSRALRPGSYRATLQAQNQLGISAPETVAFAIVR